MKHEFLSLRQQWTNRELGFPTYGHNIAVPGHEQLSRVHGTNGSSAQQHVLDGCGHCRRIMTIAHCHGFTGGTVCDWGVGYGRIARHLPIALCDSFTGVDIDHKNIAWCREHFNFGRFEVIDPFGSLPFDDSSVDLLYGFSVMTHATAMSQDYWLREINRVLRGVAVLSVHGMVCLEHNACAANFISTVIRSGLVVSSDDNPDISDVAPPGFYKDTAHAAWYIRNHWSKFVDVLDVIPGGLGIHDAVVLQTLGAS